MHVAVIGLERSSEHVTSYLPTGPASQHTPPSLTPPRQPHVNSTESVRHEAADDIDIAGISHDVNALHESFGRGFAGTDDGVDDEDGEDFEAAANSMANDTGKTTIESRQSSRLTLASSSDQ